MSEEKYVIKVMKSLNIVSKTEILFIFRYKFNIQPRFNFKFHHPIYLIQVMNPLDVISTTGTSFHNYFQFCYKFELCLKFDTHQEFNNIYIYSYCGVRFLSG